MWSLLGAKLRLHNAAGFSCAPSAALLALVILLSIPAAQSNADARDAADQSRTSDANQPDYNCNLSLAPSKLHTTIALLAYARRCWNRRIGPALGYDLKPLNRDAA